MKYNAILWSLFTGLMKKGLVKFWPREDVKGLIQRAKPIYKDLLSKVEGISDSNPMGQNITMSFIIIAIWLASEKKITPGEMSEVMDRALDIWLMKAYYGMIDMNTEKGIRSVSKMMHSKLIRNETLASGGSKCDYWILGDRVNNPQ